MQSSHVHTLVTFHLGQLGDLLFSLPALEALRRRFPPARRVAVMKPALWDLIRGGPLLHGALGHGSNGVAAFVRFVAALRRLRPDLAVCFSQSPRTLLAARLSGARVRFGFSGGRFAGTLTHTVAKEGPPSTANDLRLVEALGCQVRRRTYEGLVPVDDEATRQVDDRLAATGRPGDTRWIVLGPAASPRRALKEWPRDRFQTLAAELAARPGCAVVFVGVQPFLAGAPGLGPCVFDWSGTTTLPQLAALLRRASLFVGVDSGVLHLAAAVGVPVVALFGPTDPAVTGPQTPRHRIVRADLDCLACHRKHCPTPECMIRIPVARVLAACDQLEVFP